MKRKDNPFDRLKGMQLDDEEFDRASQNSMAGGFSNAGSVDSGLQRQFNVPQRDPFLAETVSELYDEKDKSQLLAHSFKHGVFNDLKNSPLKSKMPNNLRMYEPHLK